MVKCTIAIPSYNRAEMLPRTIESALAQKDRELEILVIDDCSTEAVVEVAGGYKDVRLRVIQNGERMGLFGNFNRCLELAQGEFLRILCNDDKLTSGCIERELEFMENNPSVSLLISKSNRVDEAGRTIDSIGDYFRPGIYAGIDAIYAILWFHAHYWMNPIPMPSGVLLRKRAYLKAGLFDTNMKMYGDLDLFLRVLQHGDLGVLSECGSEICVHPNQVSSRLYGNLDIIREAFQITDRHADLLRERGAYGRIVAQLTAFGLAMGAKLLREGHTEVGRAHVTFARKRVPSWSSGAVATGRTLTMRLLLRFLRLRLVPVKPISPL
jgi:glycosyltransferase involved in cell wall biosynthesis